MRVDIWDNDVVVMSLDVGSQSPHKIKQLIRNKYDVREIKLETPKRSNNLPWATMEVDTYFLMHKPQNAVSAAAAQAGKRLKRKFSSEKVSEGVYRIWRRA